MKVVEATQEKFYNILEWEKYKYSHIYSINWEEVFSYIGKSMGASF